MKRLLILLMLVSQPAWAEWVEMGTTGKGARARTHYMDPSTLRKTADGRRVWTMDSWEQSQTNSSGTFQSVKILWEFDCAGDRFRLLQEVLYSGPEGGGKMVAQFNPSGWQFVIPDSFGENRFKAVCSMPLK